MCSNKLHQEKKPEKIGWKRSWGKFRSLLHCFPLLRIFTSRTQARFWSVWLMKNLAKTSTNSSLKTPHCYSHDFYFWPYFTNLGSVAASRESCSPFPFQMVIRPVGSNVAIFTPWQIGLISSARCSRRNSFLFAKHHKNCECCPVSQLILRYQRLSWIQVLNCQNCIFKMVKNCLNCQKLSKIVKIVQNCHQIFHKNFHQKLS